jgi:hypothetical protein
VEQLPQDAVAEAIVVQIHLRQRKRQLTIPLQTLQL